MNSLVSLLPWFLTYGYIALFFLMVTGSLYLPVPSNIALISAGALAHFSQDGVHFNLLLAAFVGLLGSCIGDIAGYFIAREFNTKKRKSGFEKRLTSFHKIESYLKQHPLMTVGTTRLIGFLSPAVNTLSGFTRLSVRTFILGDILGNTVYVILFMGAGFVAGNTNGNALTLVGFATGILVVLGLLYIGAMLLVRDN